jgi:hypothetical protein
MRQGRRELRRAELDARISLDREAKAIAIEVVAGGNGELHFRRRPGHHASREGERLLRVEQLLRRADPRQGEKRDEESKALQARVSPATQSR